MLTGWTLTAYFIKKDSQEVIREEVTSLFDICKKFFLSLKNLIGILTSNSLSLKERDTNPVEETISKRGEQLLNVAQPTNEFKKQSEKFKYEDDNDNALSSFSPEVVEVINEEEEKVA